MSNFCPDTRGWRWSLIWANWFSCAVGREEHFKEISVACVGSARSVWATLGLPPLVACVFSRSTLFRFQVALQGFCLKRALGCMHFPSLSHSGSGSQVLRKGTDLVGPAFCAFPGPSSSGDQVFSKRTLPAGRCVLSPPRSQPLGFLSAPGEHCLRCALCLLWGADLWRQPFWWMSTIQDPRKAWLVTGSLLTV